MGEEHLNDLSRIGDRGFFERILHEREKTEKERMDRIEERFIALEALIRTETAERDKALRLQAAEYQRRFHDLNGSFERDRDRQLNYVTSDKYETGLKAEAESRARETLRMNERFDDYLEMYEKRHREVEDEVRARTPQLQFEDYKKSESDAREAALLRVNEKFEGATKALNEKFDNYVLRYEQRQLELDLRLAAQQGAAEEAQRAVEIQARKSDEAQREASRRQSRNLGLASIGLTIVVFAANFLSKVLEST